MGKKLLYVTYLTEGFEKGFSYCTELARTMGKDISVLIVVDRMAFSEKFENIMTAVTFSQANEHEFATEVISEPPEYDYADEINYLSEKCSGSGISLSIYRSTLNIIPAIKRFVQHEKGIDLILMGTTVTYKGGITTKELKRLVRIAARPVVTIEKEAVLQNLN